jgi:hypothetical protein
MVATAQILDDLNSLPEQYIDEVRDFIAYLKTKIRRQPVKADNLTKKDYTDAYPKGFWELFGSVKDESFEEPTEMSWKYDAPRETL